MRGGELKCGELAGPIDLDTNGTDITMIGSTRRPASFVSLQSGDRWR